MEQRHSQDLRDQRQEFRESLTVVQQTVSDTQAGFAGKIASLSKPRRDVSIDMFGDVEGRMEGNERDSHSLLTSMDNLEGNHASLAKKHNKLASNHDGLHREAEIVRSPKAPKLSVLPPHGSSTPPPGSSTALPAPAA